jgi:hypothetical protein
VEKRRNQLVGLERAGLQAAPYIVFKNLQPGCEAVPLQEFNAQDFPQAALKPSEIRCLSGNNVRGNP